MTTELVRYDQARQALAECMRVDDVKSIRDKAVAMQVYATQAKDTTLIDQATDIRIRAEIRAGELLAEMKVRGERRKAGDDKPPPKGKTKVSNTELPTLAPTLTDLGISRMQSSRWQKLAALPRAQQEAAVVRAKSKAARAVEGAPAKAKKQSDDDVGHEVPLSKAAINLALQVRDLVMDRAHKMKPEDRESVLLALRYEVRDLKTLFRQKFGKD